MLGRLWDFMPDVAGGLNPNDRIHHVRERFFGRRAVAHAAGQIGNGSHEAAAVCLGSGSIITA